MSATHVLAIVAIAGNGIAAGIMLSTVIGIVPLLLALPYRRYVQTVQFLRPRFDPVMPVTNGFTLALDIALAATASDVAARAAFAAAAALIASVMAVSVAKNVPVNRYVMRLDPEREPAAWAQNDPRARWRLWNLVRTALAVVAFIVSAVAAVQFA
jgi:uncharacterized membrane protein